MTIVEGTFKLRSSVSRAHLEMLESEFKVFVLSFVLGSIMTERCRSSSSAYSFSQGKAIPLPHLENVFRGYLMHRVTLRQGDRRPAHHKTAAFRIKNIDCML